jgi:hypothetical protein
MDNLPFEDKLLLNQHAIIKYEDENILLEKLSAVLSQKDINKTIATLIGTKGEKNRF